MRYELFNGDGPIGLGPVLSSQNYFLPRTPVNLKINRHRPYNLSSNNIYDRGEATSIRCSLSGWTAEHIYASFHREMLSQPFRCKLLRRTYSSSTQNTVARSRCRCCFTRPNQAKWRLYFTPSSILTRAGNQRSQATQAAIPVQANQRSLATTIITDHSLSTRGPSPSPDFLPPIPFDSSQYSSDIAHTLRSPQWKLTPTFPSRSVLPRIDPSRPLIIDNSVTVPTYRANYKSGIGGDTADLLQNLHACLRVGRIDRATAVLRRLAEIYHASAPELVEAHNHYLAELVIMVSRPNPDKQVSLRGIQHWFEVELRGKGIKPNARTFSLLFRASFALLEGSKLDRALRRYIYLASTAGNHVLNNIIFQEDLTDAEFNHLVRLRPDLFDTPVEEAEEDLSHLSESHESASDDLAEVRSVKQKGLGLKTLKKTLSAFSEANPLGKMMEAEGLSKETAYAREERLEEDAVEAAMHRWREEHILVQKLGVSSSLQSRPLNALMWQWQMLLLPVIKKELKDIREALELNETNSLDPRLQYGPFLEMLSAEKLAATAIVSLLQVLTQSGAGRPDRLARAASHVGQQLESEANLKYARAAIKSSGGTKLQVKKRQFLINKLSRHKQNFRIKIPGYGDANSQHGKPDGSVSLQFEGWPLSIKIQIGALMISKITEIAKLPVTRRHPVTHESITQMQPAFHTTITSKLGRKIGQISMHPDLVKKLGKEPMKGMIAKRLPMLVEPRPWKGYREGGYLRYPVSIVRAKERDEAQQHYVRAAIEKGDMDQVFKGLDILSKTPWNINRGVLDVMLQAWNSGEPIGELAPENYSPPLPPEPATPDRKAHFSWLAQLGRIENEKCGFHSKRCFQNFQLEIARAFANDTFYFPHNVDFRGRAYPIPPILNHMGADFARGMLIFAEGKELGHIGLKWLKIHLANLYGFDKANLQEREDFTMEHLGDIYDSAINPLNGKRWWLEAESPWQCLGVCMELKNALDSPDPTHYVSHVPVHQDGTCNGLQHYAALGGDLIGARQVNLEPGDRPADIYSGVAQTVAEEIEKDMAKNNPAAKLLHGHITRKVVKQTVMTNVYGVTYAGARQQVRKRLEELMPNMVDTPEMNFSLLSSYVARKIFEALSTMFEGAHHIQHWLGQCATRITAALTPEQIEKIELARKGKPEPVNPKFKKQALRSKPEHGEFKSPVIWTSPLKMPVVQPYRDGKVSKIATGLQYISIAQPRVYDPISRRKQLQGFPPNFIHSLDATHMLLSALRSEEIGITFAAVHDSFWTHASDIPALSHLLRDAFVRMHSENIMDRLREEFEARYKDCIYLAAIPHHHPAVNKIKAWRKKKNSRKGANLTKQSVKGDHNELLLERDRQRFLRSPDPVLQAKGKAMVTPASIWEDCGGSVFEFSQEPAGLSESSPKDPMKESGDEIFGQDANHANPNDKVSNQSPSSSSSIATGISTVDNGEATSLDLEQDGDVEIEIEDTPQEDSSLKPLSLGDASRQTRSGGLDHEEDKHSGDSDLLLGLAVRQKKQVIAYHLWLPMQIPPVPKRGDFDVRKLNESQYFFS